MAVPSEGAKGRRAVGSGRPAKGKRAAGTTRRPAGGTARAGAPSSGGPAASARKRSSPARKRPTATSKRPASRAAPPRSDPPAERNGTLKTAGISALSATIGVAGGVLLGRSALQRNRKVLGVPVPTKVHLGVVSQQIAEAGRQFGKLAIEVRAVREKAEQIGRVLMRTS